MHDFPFFFSHMLIKKLFLVLSRHNLTSFFFATREIFHNGIRGSQSQIFSLSFFFTFEDIFYLYDKVSRSYMFVQIGNVVQLEINLLKEDVQKMLDYIL